MDETMDDCYLDAHSDDEQHEAWTPDEPVCPISGEQLVDEAGLSLPF